jgi:hypothetical protein
MQSITASLSRFDFFKSPVPPFTLYKKHGHGTSIGFLFSVLISIMIVSYTAVKGSIVYKKSHTTITTYKRFKSLQHSVDLKKIGFALAFRVNAGRAKGWTNLDDPQFVEYAPMITEKITTEDGRREYTNLPLNFHKCNSSDEDTFFNELHTNSKPDLKNYWCLDQYDQFGNPVNFTLYRMEHRYRKISLRYRPSFLVGNTT